MENKYLVSDAQLEILASRLAAVMDRDIHQDGSSYQVRSLYFDDLLDQGMNENEAGLDEREKYRIRFYNDDTGTLHLERKEKFRGLVRKELCDLSILECRSILDGTQPLIPGERKLLNLLQITMRCCRMEPKVIIHYERTAFVYPAGNVRITFDRNIQASLYCRDFLDEQVRGYTPVLPAGMHILEVKYDECIPDYISRLLETGNLRQTAFSKYYWGRQAVGGCFPQTY